MTSVDEIWGSVCEKLRETLMPPIYKVWITPLSLVSFDGRAVDIVASEMAQKVLRQQCYNELLEAFRETVGFDVELNFITEAQASAESSEEAEEELLDEEEKCTFDNFVVGPSNRFAHAAALAVANEPVVRYNPLFIYGDSGLGKTHLLCAISNAVKEKNPDAKIIFTGGERFMNQIITGIRDHNMEAIHEQYRNCDVLLVDDIQFIAGKASTQEEFFHTFDALHKAQKQIVLTSDRPPKDMEVLNDRLRTRFEWGLIADIQAPDIETRMAIIQRKAQTLGLELPLDVVEHISEKIKTNVRQLEGVVKKINALVNLEGSAINIAMVESAMRDFVSDSRPVGVIVDKIIEETGRTFGVAAEDISSMKRDAKTAKARQVAVYAVREVTGLTQEEIGVFFGGRDRTTILYSYDKVAEAVARDPAMRKTVENIMKNVREGKTTIQ
ncbi:chromosomal replication initiator protein dnaA [Clostridium sp. CAG:413]|jgi:chromosomal replication initiator protein|nr:chromosomal replication initiator protein DnaA [Clostridium sp.]CDC10696.1 chromosomal replication initiator protein dnaA [Clostridium sp. CAG:413]